MSKAGFPKINMSGSGYMKPPPSIPLTRKCQPGDIVNWDAEDGNHIGELYSWDGNVAIIKIGNTTVVVIV